MDNETTVTDSALMEMADHAKTLVERAESLNNELKIENLELKKIIITCYGMVRILDQNYDYGCDRDHELYSIVGFLRSFLSEAIEAELE